MAPDRPSYTIAEANELLPQVRSVLLQLAVEKGRLERAVAALAAHAERSTGNGDSGHSTELARTEAEMTEIGGGMRALVEHLESLGIELRDLEQGLVDFPGERNGERVWLCWRLAEPEVAFWHPLDQGFDTRQAW